MPWKVVGRKIWGLIIASVGVFMYFFAFLSIEYEHARQRLKYVDWDVKTITAADYAVEFDITKEMYDHFIKEYYDKTNPLTELC